MDVYKVDRALTTGLGSAPQPPPDKIDLAVSFDAGSEFNLSFFDRPEDTQGGFSDPGSVGSASVSSPPPPPRLPSPQLLPPAAATASNAAIRSVSPATVKQGQGITHFPYRLSPPSRIHTCTQAAFSLLTYSGMIFNFKGYTVPYIDIYCYIPYHKIVY